MQVKLLKSGYKNDKNFYQAFLNNQMGEYISEDEEVLMNETDDFPIYLGKKRDLEKRQDFLEIVRNLEKDFLTLDRKYSLDERFWHSYLCLYKRDYLLEKYPEIQESEKSFRNIILKKFDWENYLYKGMLAAQYVNDIIKDKDKHEDYYGLILDNLDIFNYVIKYEIFRNAEFLIHFLEIIRDTYVDGIPLSKILKAKIKGRDDLGKDERYGRRVIYEFNKSYPMVLAPMLDKTQLKKYVLNFLRIYYDPKTSLLDEADEIWSEGER